MLLGSIVRMTRYVNGSMLHGKALQGGAWLGFGSVTAQIIRFGRNILLTRLLAPESFGIMAIVLSVCSMMDAFTEIGIKEAIIQNPRGNEKAYVNSAWWLSFLRSIIIYSVMFAFAPTVAHYYESPQLAPLLRIALLSLVFNGAISPRAFVALKDMKFRTWAVIQYGSGIAGTLLTVGLVFALRNVWALAIGFALEYATRVALSYAICPFRPGFELETEAARDLLRFSRGIVGLSFLNFLFSRSDVFFLGKSVRADQLGIYTIGIYLAQVPASFVLEWLAQIFLPMFSQVKEDLGHINDTLARVTSCIVILCIPVVIFIALTGRALLAGLYGARYTSAFAPLVVATLVACVNIANGQITTVLYATGNPHRHRLCVGIMALIMIGLLYPAVRLCGTMGAQLSALLAVSVGYVLQLWQIRRLTGFRLARLGRRLAVSSAGALCLFGLAIAVRPLVECPGPLFEYLYGAGASCCALILSAFLSLGASGEQRTDLASGSVG